MIKTPTLPTYIIKIICILGILLLVFAMTTTWTAHAQGPDSASGTYCYQFQIIDANETYGPVRSQCFSDTAGASGQARCNEAMNRCRPHDPDSMVCAIPPGGDCAPEEAPGGPETENEGGTTNPTPNGPDAEPHEYTPPPSYEITQRINNPLQSDDLFSLIDKIYNGVMLIVIPILVVALVYTGFVFVGSQGNDEKLKKAKQNATYIVIGIIIVLAADIILALIRTFLEIFN